ncbi:MAG: hypothetical protein AAGM22_11565 [Acidobacteriota bacterium]
MLKSYRPLLRPAAVLLVAGLLGASAAAQDVAEDPADRLTALLLDYHAPIEHDVLQSFLCVEPCTASAGCPEELRRNGVDFWNEDLALYRPAYLGQSARFVVQAYMNKGVDLLSISGHHASGFSGEFGRGSFHTTELARQLRDLPGRDDFFTDPAMVMLQGCWTDVKSGFVGDPIDYVRHIVEDTSVRAGQSQRLLAAIQQIAGEDEAYRELFPNACILGYQGTQIPGGLAEIYGQTSALFRGIAGLRGQELAPKYSITEARRTPGALEQLVREVDKECGGSGWPCNLCKRDPEHYRPVARAVFEALRSERGRLLSGSSRGAPAAKGLETVLEQSSLYANARWSCSTAAPGTPPSYPEPIDRAPHLGLFMELLMVDLGEIRGDQRRRIESELVHLLGATEVDGETRRKLREQQQSDAGTAWRRHFTAGTLAGLSSFRQRDFYDFLSEIGCDTCFAEVFADGVPQPRRENAASQLRPRLGPEIYRMALGDPSPRVRLLAASRLTPTLGEDLYAMAAGDSDPRVPKAAAEAWTRGSQP